MPRSVVFQVLRFRPNPSVVYANMDSALEPEQRTAKWATSDTFGGDDLPLLAKVADLARMRIFVETQNGLGDSENGQHKPIKGSGKAI